jgi:hypothetical protein
MAGTAAQGGSGGTAGAAAHGGSGGSSGAAAQGGSGDTAGQVDSGGSAGAAGQGDAGASGDPGCNALTASGPGFTPTNSSGSPPTLGYGTFAPGTYQLTEETFYDPSATGANGVGIAQVSVVGQTVTVSRVTSFGGFGEDRDTLVVVMGAPSGAPPDSITVACASGTLAPYAGLDVKSAVQYQVVGDTLSVYFAPLGVLLGYQLIH